MDAFSFFCLKRTKSTRITGLILALVVASWSGNLILTQNWMVLFKHDGPQVRVIKMSDTHIRSVDRKFKDKLNTIEPVVQDSPSMSPSTPLIDRASPSSSKMILKGNDTEIGEVSDAFDLPKGNGLADKNESNFTAPLEPAVSGRNNTMFRLEKQSNEGRGHVPQSSHHRNATINEEMQTTSPINSNARPAADSENGVEMDLKEELLKTWREFDNTTNVGMKEVVNAVKPTIRPINPADDVTVATFTTTQQLPHLLVLLTRWTGPVQVAVYLTSDADIQRFTSFHQAHRSNIGNVGFHVLFEKPGSKEDATFLPEAILRNLAMNQVGTDYLINIDVEYMTSHDCHATLQKMIRANPRVRAFLNDRYVMVLPAFESRLDNETAVNAPSTKKQILDGRENNSLDLIPMPFLKNGKYPTKYGMWSRNFQDGDIYPTEYETGYEPIVLAHRKLVPQYYTEFRGPWHSQVAWMEEMVMMGYKMGVLRHVFVFRVEPKDRIEPAPFAETRFENFRRMVWRMYDYPLIVNTAHSIDYNSCPLLPSATEGGGGFSSREIKILCEWKNFTESTETRRQVISAINHDNLDTVDGEITLATQGSVDRLERLVDSTARWNGPISAAIYVNSEASLTELFDFYRANRRALKRASFHLFFEKIMGPRDKQYPHNYLRNLAMNNIQTDYVINIDIDFCLNENAHDGLVNLLQTDRTVRESLDNRTMLILPAFENTFHVEDEDVLLAPRDKAEVIEQVKKSKQAEAFHLKKYFAGHGNTRFEKWYANKTGVMYETEYVRGFEPYVLAKKTGLPQFWTKFRGFGYNKRSWLEEAHRMGYHFTVLRDFFVFHVGQSSTRTQPQSWVKREYDGRFSVYLDKHYPQ